MFTKRKTQSLVHFIITNAQGLQIMLEKIDNDFLKFSVF